MKDLELPIPIYEIAFLQAYLLELFSLEGQCHKNFDRTIWHLKQKYSNEKIESVISFFKSRGLKCDCDVIHKFDLRDMSEKKIKFHEQGIN